MSETEEPTHDAAAGSEAVTERDFVHLLSKISSKLDVLTFEVKCLKADNGFLRSELALLNKRLLERPPLASRPHALYLAAAVASSGLSGNPPSASGEVLGPSTLEAPSAAPTWSN